MEPHNLGELHLSCPHEPTLRYTTRYAMCPDCYAWSWVTTFGQRLGSGAVIFDALHCTVLGPMDDVSEHLKGAVKHILNHSEVTTGLLRYDARVRE